MFMDFSGIKYRCLTVTMFSICDLGFLGEKKYQADQGRLVLTIYMEIVFMAGKVICLMLHFKYGNY